MVSRGYCEVTAIGGKVLVCRDVFVLGQRHFSGFRRVFEAKAFVAEIPSLTTKFFQGFCAFILM